MGYYTNHTLSVSLEGNHDQGELEEKIMANSEDVQKWMKNLNRRGPFYLWETTPHPNGQSYIIIWNDGAKTKIGQLHDGLWCRYGINTWSVLNGSRPHDLWNGFGITDDEFEAMLAVREHRSLLPKFKLETLKDLRW
jgi:hypothetical protein